LQRRSTSGGSSLERQGGLRRPGEVVVRDDGTSVMSSMSSPPGIERQVMQMICLQKRLVQFLDMTRK
jgi:hypothetical protein